MSDRLEHDDRMELAVKLACSHLARTGSSKMEVVDLLVHFYNQIQTAEERLLVAREAAQQEEEAVIAVVEEEEADVAGEEEEVAA